MTDESVEQEKVPLTPSDPVLNRIDTAEDPLQQAMNTARVLIDAGIKPELAFKAGGVVYNVYQDKKDRGSPSR